MKNRFTSIGVDRLRMQTDGVGITTLVAGYGCPLRCQYCLNPQCFSENNNTTKNWELQELIDYLKIDDLYFQSTGGGITFGGGEPLLQAEFIHEFRKACPKEWKVYLETSLSVPLEKLEMIWDDIDEYLVDIKDMNPGIYMRYTGQDNAVVKTNLEKLIRHVGTDKIIVRVPLIQGFNTDEDRHRSVEQLKSMGITNFDLLEYNLDRGKSKRKK